MGTQLQTARPRRPRALRQATQFPAPPRQFAQRSQPQHGSQGRSPYAPLANAPQCAGSTARANGRRSSARANEDCHPSVPADAEESGVRAGLAPPLRCLRDGVADDVVGRGGLFVLAVRDRERASCSPARVCRVALRAADDRPAGLGEFAPKVGFFACTGQAASRGSPRKLLVSAHLAACRPARLLARYVPWLAQGEKSEGVCAIGPRGQGHGPDAQPGSRQPPPGEEKR